MTIRSTTFLTQTNFLIRLGGAKMDDASAVRSWAGRSLVNSMNCRASVSTVVRVWAGITAWMVLCANATQAAIVEVSGAGALVTESMIEDFVDPHHCPNCGGRFYVNKATAGHEHDSREFPLLQAINERTNVTLSATIQTNNPPFEQVVIIEPPPSPIGWEKPGPPIPVGQVVNSHYIWLNAPCDSQQGCNIKHDIATFKFDGPIIGLIGGPVELNASNGPLGFDSVPLDSGIFVGYTPTVTGFVNERCNWNPSDPATGILPSGDVVTKLAPAILRVDFTSISGDYVRVVTAANVPLHAGDFDHDYDVDSDDYAIWRLTFGSISDLRADANGNAVVDAGDFVVWRHENGYSYAFPGAGGGSGAEVPFGSVVPEPSSAAVLLGGILLSTLPRQRRRVNERMIAG